MDSFLAALASGCQRIKARILLVAAHPDDEVIGLGGLMPRLPGIFVLHVTDGAPRDGEDARTAGFGTPADYATARRDELAAALALAGIGAERLQTLGVPDQEASLRLPEAIEGVATALREQRPDVVVIHPYEGGHPDHDATALAAHAALHLLRRDGKAAPALVEMTSYHASAGGIATGRFLPADGFLPVVIRLPEEAMALKRRMLACFTSQQRTLRHFPLADTEALRPAPPYRFRQPPHPGRLHYENHPWGMTGERFRALAGEALDALGIGEAI